MMNAEALPYALLATERSTALAEPVKSTALTISTIRSATAALRDLRVEDAIEDYRQVLELEPDTFDALAGTGIALTRAGLTDQAPSRRGAGRGQLPQVGGDGAAKGRGANPGAAHRPCRRT